MKVYLDNAATTAVDGEALRAMLPYFSEEMGNAQSVHSFGRRAKAAVEHARRQVASLINADPTEIIFLSGGTESDNLAIRGVARAYGASGRHIITTRIEHPAVLAACQSLEQEGFRVTYLPVDRSGVVSVESVRDAIASDTILISVMHANNETGAIQPIEEIGRVIDEARAAGSAHLRFHTDAVQSVGKTAIDVARLGVDLLSISAHKIHGPKGAGALYARKGVRLAKLLHGGHHERDRRPGTENVTGIVGLGKAAEIARARIDEMDRVRGLRDYFESELRARINDVNINASVARLPNISNITFCGIDGEALLIALDLRDIAVSTGSACSSGSLEPSHVLTAMGFRRDEVLASLRFSLSLATTREEIDYTLRAIEEIVPHLQRLSEEDDEEAALPLESEI